MTIALILVTLLAALLSGAVGGSISAGSAARRAEQAKDRYRAERAIRATLLSYKAMLVYDHDQVYVVSSYPVSYADIKGQESFAAEVLKWLPFLTARTRNVIRDRLATLITPTSLEWVEKYIDVPVDARDSERDDKRQFMEQYRALREASDPEGLIRRLIRTQNDPQHNQQYAEVLAVFDELLLLVKIDDLPWWERGLQFRMK